jgi:hypothetical protein
MKVTIIGRIITIDHKRQSFMVKPDNSAPTRLYADEKVFAKIASAVEAGRIAGKEAYGAVDVSGKVAIAFIRLKSKYRPGDLIIESPLGVFSFDRLLEAMDSAIAGYHSE